MLNEVKTVDVLVSARRSGAPMQSCFALGWLSPRNLWQRMRQIGSAARRRWRRYTSVCAVSDNAAAEPRSRVVCRTQCGTYCLMRANATIRGIILLVAFSMAISVQAQGPAWWYARGAVDNNLQANDYAPITCGQLKWLATNACDEMNAYFGAGTEVASVINAFSSSNNYYPANIGQLKYVAQPFYNRLYAFNLTNTFPANMPGYYPWGNAAQTNDYALANIGQAKYVFSFDSSVDSDGDGLIDWLEAQLGTDPYNPDTDGDGLSDGWELAHDTDPLDDSDGNPDEVINQREEARQRIIHYWQLYYGATPEFNNAPGSAADMLDLNNALNALSGKFYKVQ